MCALRGVEDDLAGDPKAGALASNGQGPPSITDRLPPEAPQLTREQQRLRMLERQSAYDQLTTGASVLV